MVGYYLMHGLVVWGASYSQVLTMLTWACAGADREAICAGGCGQGGACCQGAVRGCAADVDPCAYMRSQCSGFSTTSCLMPLHPMASSSA